MNVVERNADAVSTRRMSGRGLVDEMTFTLEIALDGIAVRTTVCTRLAASPGRLFASLLLLRGSCDFFTGDDCILLVSQRRLLIACS